MKKINIGIDASRNRSGGAKAHIIGILGSISEADLQSINEIHIWAYKELLNTLPDTNWLIKHSPEAINKSLIHQLYWQYKKLPVEAKRNHIDILLNTDAGSVCRFKPCVTMSRDMLSYEKGEMSRYGLSFMRLRLIILKFAQNSSLRKATGAIFLTEYAAKTIQKSCGNLNNYTIIPHGVSNNFRINTNNGNWSNKKNNEPIKCIYVSNVDYYKHQWNVALAIETLHKEGYNVQIQFIGGGTGKAQEKFENVLKEIPNSKEFIFQLDFIKHLELPLYLSQADIFIFASSCENMPNTLIEGMCTGLPIVCSDRGPMPEVLKDGGIYFDPENTISIKDALKTIIDDDNIRKSISSKSKDLSIQYSWKRCAAETFDYLIKTYNSTNKNKIK